MNAVLKPSATMHPDEWAARLQLAACYRVFDLLGWTEMIYNHITVRLPDSVTGGKKQFLINPFGLHYSEVTASNLLKIDVQGNKLDENPWPVNPAGFTVHSAIHEGIEQAHCVIGVRGVAVDDDDRFALDLIAQILGGQGGRLFLDLRDRRGLAYAVDAMNVEGLDPGWFAVSIATAPEQLEQARAGMLAELERLVASEPGADELARARRYLSGSFAIDHSTTLGWFLSRATSSRIACA